MASLRVTDYEEITKRRLLYARLLLELFAKQQKDVLYGPALLSSAVLQLNLAYEAFIEELQVRLNVTPYASHNLTEILRYLKAKDIHSSELLRLVALERQEKSWLSCMRAGLSRNIDDKTLSIQANIIGSSANQTDQIENHPLAWLEKMEELCEHMRQMMTEY